MQATQIPFEAFSSFWRKCVSLEHTSTQLPRGKEVMRGLGLATLSGVLWVIACPAFDLWVFSWIAMVPTIYVVERATSTGRVVLFAWWAGLIGNIGGFYWIIGTLERFGHLPRIVAVSLFALFCAYQALRFLVFGWLLMAFRRNTRLPVTFIAPVVMVTAELCVPCLFSHYLAIALAWHPQFIQIADLTGPLGVTALLLMINGAIYELAIKARYALASATVSALILVAALGYGYIRISQVLAQRANAPILKVGIVQPNSANNLSSGAVYSISQLSRLQSQSAQLEAAGADLIVWPESSYPMQVARPLIEKQQGRFQNIKGGIETHLLMGAITYEAASGRMYNSALMIGPDGSIAGMYDKNNLLMFGEYVPGLDAFPSIKTMLPNTVTQFSRGSEVRTFPLQTKDGNSWRVGTMICLEDVLPSFGRKLAALKPHLMVNIINDSWFGDTNAPWQHLALSVYRSIEIRTEMVRATTTGVSAVIDASGRVRAKTYSFDPVNDSRDADKLLVDVSLTEDAQTVYAAVGDLFGYLNAIITFYALLILPASHRWKFDVHL